MQKTVACNPEVAYLRKMPNRSVPGDKSIAHRALLLGLLCDTVPQVAKLPAHDDCRVTQTAVTLIRDNPKGCTMDCDGSGTTLRLLMGLLAGCDGTWTLVGSPQLDARPVERVAAALRGMGAQISIATADRRRITICGRPLTGTRYLLEVPSAQLKTALIFAGLQSEGETVIVEPIPSRDHTECLVRHWGGYCECAGNEIRVRRSRLSPRDIILPGDFSTAAFAIAKALLIPRSDVLLSDVGLNPTRTGMLKVLMRMKASLSAHVTQEDWEPRGDITVHASPNLHATTITATELPSLIDEIPVLTILALFARGTSRFEGLSELRFKESNRLEGMAAEIRKCGARLEVDGDNLTIHGGQSLHAAKLDSLNDHRLAMAFGVLECAVSGVTVIGKDCVAKSCPEFWNHL